MKRLALLLVVSCSTPPSARDQWRTRPTPFALISPLLAMSALHACRGEWGWSWLEREQGIEVADLFCRERSSGDPTGFLTGVNIRFRRPEYLPAKIHIQARSIGELYALFDRLIAPMLLPDARAELRDSIAQPLTSIARPPSHDEVRLYDTMKAIRIDLVLPLDVAAETSIGVRSTFGWDAQPDRSLPQDPAHYEVFTHPDHGYVGAIVAGRSPRDRSGDRIEVDWWAYLPPVSR
jgi:hypothetical protein